MKSKTKKVLGIILMIYPVPLLVVVLSVYAIVEFVVGALVGGGDPGFALVLGNLFRVISGLLALFAVLGIFVGFPLGLVLYIQGRKAEKAEQVSVPVSLADSNQAVPQVSESIEDASVIAGADFVHGSEDVGESDQIS